MRLRRALTVLTLTALAVAGLSGCDSKIGRAAQVNSSTLSDSDLAGYVKPGTTPYTDSQGTRVVPKVNVIEYWVRAELLKAAIVRKGGDVTASEERKAEAALLGGNDLSGPEKNFVKLGYQKRFGDLAVEQTALLIVLVERLAKGISPDQVLQALQSQTQGPQVNAAILAAIKAARSTVTVSPRYGTWDAKNLQIATNADAGAPDFVHFGSGTSTHAP